MSTQIGPRIAVTDAPPYFRDKLTRLIEAAQARDLAPLLTLAQSVHPEPQTIWHSATRSGTAVIANIEVADAPTAHGLIHRAEALQLPVFLDCSQKGPQSQSFRELVTAHPATGIYSDLSIWAEATLALLLPHLTPGPLSEVLLIGASPLTDALASRASQYGYDLTRAMSIVGAEPGPMALVGTSFHRPVIEAASLEAIARDGVTPLCIDAGIGTFTPEALAVAHGLGWTVYRPDMRAALTTEIERLQQYARLVTQHAGSREIAGVPCVAGGVVGPAGALVLDRIDAPSEILGWADGAGGLVRETTDPEWLAARERVILGLGMGS